MNLPSKRHQGMESGFIPMIIMLILILVGVMYFAYMQVMRAQQ